jgi:hypothetical protein
MPYPPPALTATFRSELRLGSISQSAFNPASFFKTMTLLTTREEAESKPFPPLRVQLIKMVVLIVVLFGTVVGVMNLFVR